VRMPRRFLPLCARAAVILAAGFCFAAPVRAQEEPELIPQQQAAEPAKPAIDTTPPPTATGPLRPSLDFQRWREMTARERQTFVEGAVQSMSALALRMRSDLEVGGKVPPESLAAVVRFIHDHYPKFPPSSYLREMESIYSRTDGQNLSMAEAFEQAFRRINAR
jgi:hypothetical protein